MVHKQIWMTSPEIEGKELHLVKGKGVLSYRYLIAIKISFSYDEATLKEKS